MSQQLWFPSFVQPLTQNGASVFMFVWPSGAMSKHCPYWKYRDDPPCSETGAYPLELVSRQGSRCQVTVCRDHIHKAWEFGQRILEYRFPGRKLKLSMVRLMPILETTTRKQAKAAGADG